MKLRSSEYTLSLYFASTSFTISANNSLIALSCNGKALTVNCVVPSDVTKYELYQTLLILGDQKKVLNVEKYQSVKVYTDPISNKRYTKRSS